MPCLEGLHAEYILRCRGFGSDHEGHHADDFAGSVLHGAEEQATIDFMTAF